MRGRPVQTRQKHHQTEFQSTPPCGGDFNIQDGRQRRPISIHAPLRGRRRIEIEIVAMCGFQSTPPCGGDLDAVTTPPEPVEFQSTPPCGGDTADTFNVTLPPISIHAPLRGRPHGSRCHGTSEYFNPRPLAGATYYEMKPIKDDVFQSTPPCGGDQRSWKPLPTTMHFNPRPLAGATPCSPSRSCISAFQSTPPCGGDLKRHAGEGETTYFNPRPLAGATPCPEGQDYRSDISIHAPLRGRP